MNECAASARQLARLTHGLGGLLAYFSHPNADLRLVRRTWWAGFCGLPLLWLLNWLNFRKAAQEPDAPTELKILARTSLVLFSIVMIASIAWLVYFQTVADTMPCSCEGIFGTDSRCAGTATRALIAHLLAISFC